MRCGLIGLGAWGKNIFRELGDKLVAVCELDTNICNNYARPGVVFTNDLPEFLELCDAVFIATPIHTHYSITKTALEHKKHVWIEKPFCTDSKHANELVILANHQNVRLFIGHIMNYHGCFLMMLEWLRQHPREHIIQFISERGKVVSHNQIFPGDLLWDLAPHDISVMRRLMHGNHVGLNCHGTDLHVSARYVFSSGQEAYLTWSRLFVQKRASYTLVTENYLIMLDDTKSDTSEKLLVQNRLDGSMQYIEPPRDCSSPLQNEIRAFLDQSEEPYTVGDEGLQVVKLLEALKENLKT
jgi:predicted dehydrogenase